MASSGVGIDDSTLIEMALQQVRDSMKDPSSAQFEDVQAVAYQDGKVVCGSVNAKNSYGGYVGFTPFVAVASGADIYFDSEFPKLDAAANAGLRAACR